MGLKVDVQETPLGIAKSLMRGCAQAEAELEPLAVAQVYALIAIAEAIRGLADVIAEKD